MKVLIDINHPAHVHVFKHVYFSQNKYGYECCVVATTKDIATNLLREYKIPFYNIGTYGKSLLSKLVKLIILDIKFFIYVLRTKPNIMIGVASIRISHIGKLLGIPTYNFEDTENSPEQIFLYKPFVTKIYTPSCFENDLGRKQIRYAGYHEMAYLHPNRYAPNADVLKIMAVQQGEIYTIIRFVSSHATHDINHRKINEKEKVDIVMRLAKYGRVFITSEECIPKEIDCFKICLPYNMIHDAIYYAALVYGESATMSSEAAILGVPSIFVDRDGRGYTNEQESRYGLVFNFKDTSGDIQRSIEKAEEILRSYCKQEWISKSNVLLSEKIDVTQYMIDNIIKRQC